MFWYGAVMNAQLPSSELILQLSTTSQLTTTTDSQKAWHIFAVLLANGLPAPPAELASKCTIFDSSSGEVRFLCSIPNSPISLTSDHFVTLSPVGFAAIARFITNDNVICAYWYLVSEFVPRWCGLRNVMVNDVVRTNLRKRKRMSTDDKDFSVVKMRCFFDMLAERSQKVTESNEIDDTSTENFSSIIRYSTGMNMLPTSTSSGLAFDKPKLEMLESTTILAPNSGAGHLSYKVKNVDWKNRDSEDNLQETVAQRIMNGFTHPELPILPGISENLKVTKDDKADVINPTGYINLNTTSCTVADQKITISGPQTETIHPGYKAEENKKVMGEVEEQPLSESNICRDYNDNMYVDITHTHKSPKSDLGVNRVNMLNNVIQHGHKLKMTRQAQEHELKQPAKSSLKRKCIQKDAINSGAQAVSKTAENRKYFEPPAESLQFKRDKRHISTKQKNQMEEKQLPEFESFITEEEEGSGGYGTVYRARRKDDGCVFAIKCPHDNANRNYVLNERKMLERFGGKNFVIKFECSLKKGDSDCFVLQHVEHDRPEVLKREIDVDQLQWYGYCMFKALASIHKQGIVHRDVKPGNFLFSRKVNKGYLIDFNLALDLHHKYGITDNSKDGHSLSYDHIPPPNTKSPTSSRNRKSKNIKGLEMVNQDAGKSTKFVSLPRNLKRKSDQAQVCTNPSNKNIVRSQGADGSGITSAKDATGTRNSSAGKLREPIPCQGRKELISLAREALQGENQNSVKIPISKRKRVAASPGKMDSKFFYPTPMPLHGTGIAIGGAGLLKGKGNGKHRREGPCVGTKGFRAPEVLFKSLHQGPKVDIWSAGVTLLYMMIGRSPFVGDPDQNIKEIAKLRGSEDLWEVAKIHDNESLFPVDLLNVKYLQSIKLQDWCERNTRRLDFLDSIPRSLFDLVDKCLTVNPRLRISAEEALRHDFFSSCHETIKRHRMQRQGLSLDIGTSKILNGQSQTIEVTF